METIYKFYAERLGAPAAPSLESAISGSHLIDEDDMAFNMHMFGRHQQATATELDDFLNEHVSHLNVTPLLGGNWLKEGFRS